MVLPSQAYFAYDYEWVSFGPDQYFFEGTYQKLQVVSHEPAPASIQPGGDWENLKALADELQIDFVPPVDSAISSAEQQPLVLNQATPNSTIKKNETPFEIRCY